MGIRWAPLIVLLMLVSGCGIRVLDPQSDTAKVQTELIYFSFGIMVLVLLTVFGLMARFVKKYRDDGSSDYLPTQTEGNKKLEITWTVIPILIVIILAVPTTIVTMNQSPNSEAISTAEDSTGEEVHVRVEAERFSWTFRYENGKTSEDLYLPEGATAVLTLRSKDVIHSFWVPSLGGKVDVLPHKDNVYEIENVEEGVYLGKCAEFCGTYHTKMRFTTHVVSEQEYREWLEN
ncbi:cytochrome c oxidase subunit 2 [Halobacillus dabanensis]|uniref:Cytochrome c oxidase subunit 2 n=1 Tax=Halobacillus dabanensis TaxID=240302 RepID=A0A1I3U0Y1_HALDA|nr:cytochrome c oxidase subunit II [Halobacillus dabanensis]SFJ76620.1 cytochrome c oxidase subunit 2 [Halobacillus dabanensis]